jgi:hypothetical protein
MASRTAKSLGLSEKQYKKLKKKSPFEVGGTGVPSRKTGKKNIKRAKNPKEYLGAMGTYTIRKDLHKSQEGDWTQPRKKKPKKLKTSYLAKK